jgi:glucokinase
MTGSGLYAGVDLGGSKIAGVLLGPPDPGDGVLATAWREHRVTDADSAQDAIETGVSDLRAAHAAARRPGAQTPAVDIAAVGVAVAGWIDAEAHTVRHAANLGLRDLPLPSRLSERLGVPVVMDNDGNAAAYAEFHVAAGEARRSGRRPPRCLLALSIGTGLGAGLVLDGVLWRGAFGLGAEIGHLPISAEDRPCICGGNGCAELYISGGGLSRRAAEAGVGDGTGARSLFAAARRGDVAATRLVERAGTAIGRLLTLVSPVVEPDLVVLGGSVGAAAADLLIPAAEREFLARRSMPAVTRPPRIVATTLGPEAAAIGAARLAQDLTPAEQNRRGKADS